MVEFRTRRRDMRGDGGNHFEKLGLKKFSCAIQLTIPDMASMSPDLACNTTETKSSQPNKVSHTPDLTDSLLSSTSFSSSSPISLFLVHNSTIIAEHKVKSFISISPCHDHELTPSTSIHRVPHTPSTTYTEYHIHRVPHTPSTTYTKYYIHQVQHTPESVCVPFILRITSGPLNVTQASSMPLYTIDRHQPARHESSKVQSPCHIPTFAS